MVYKNIKIKLTLSDNKCLLCVYCHFHIINNKQYQLLSSAWVWIWHFFNVYVVLLLFWCLSHMRNDRVFIEMFYCVLDVLGAIYCSSTKQYVYVIWFLWKNEHKRKWLLTKIHSYRHSQNYTYDFACVSPKFCCNVLPYCRLQFVVHIPCIIVCVTVVVQFMWYYFVYCSSVCFNFSFDFVLVLCRIKLVCI